MVEPSAEDLLAKEKEEKLKKAMDDREEAVKAREKRIERGHLMADLDADVISAVNSGFKWLEVDDEVFSIITKHKEPKCGYIIYKNIKVCREGMAEGLAAQEGMTIHEIVFKDEAKKMRVTTVI